jgi:hypothetical protein
LELPLRALVPTFRLSLLHREHHAAGKNYTVKEEVRLREAWTQMMNILFNTLVQEISEL